MEGNRGCGLTGLSQSQWNEAIERLNVGVSIYSAGLVLLAFNRRFVQLLELPHEVARIGTPFAEIVRFLAVRGEYGPGDADAIVARRLDPLQGLTDPLTFERRRPNGMYLEGTTCRLGGGGFITILADISQRKQREEELRLARAELEIRVQGRTMELRQREEDLLHERTLLQSVLDNMRHGVAVLDRDLRLQIANPMLASVLGYPQALIQPGTPYEHLLRFDAERNGMPAGEGDEVVRQRLASVRNPDRHVAMQRYGERSIEVCTDAMPGGGAVITYSDVTERREHEARLLESRRHLNATLGEFELILRNASLGIMTVIPEADGRRVIRRLNLALARMLGYDEAELVGQETEMLYATMADHKAVGKAYRQFIEKGATYRGEHAFRRKDGQPVPIALSGSAIDSQDFTRGAIWLVEDITERKESAERLLRQQQRLDNILAELVLILRNAPLGILTVIPTPEGDRVMRRVNIALETMLGYARGELEGRSTRVLYADENEYRAVSQAYVDVVCAGRAYHGERLFRRKGGSLMHGALSGSAIDPEHPERGAIWFIEDVSEHKRMQAELEVKTTLLKDGTDHMPGGMVIWDSDLCYMLWTPNTEADWNLPPGTLTRGMPLADVFRIFAERGDFGPGDVETLLRQRMQPFRDRVAMHVEQHMPDGRILDIRRNPLPSGGYVSVFHDITDRKHMEMELIRTTVAAEAARAKLASLLDNSGQGFLLFGEDLIIDAEFSWACLAMLGGSPAGREAADVLFAGDENKAGLLRASVPIILAEPNARKREIMLSLLPTEHEVHGRHVRVEYKIIEQSKIMIVLTDITEEKHLAARVENERRRLELIVAAVTDSRDFFDAVDSFRSFCATGLPHILAQPVPAPLVVKEIYRQVHTYKGLLSQFYFPRLPARLHEMEGGLDRLARQEGPASMEEVQAVVALSDLGGVFEADLAILRDALGDEFLQHGQRVVLNAEQAEQLETLADRLLHGEKIDVALAHIRKFLLEIGSLRKMPITDALAGFDRGIRQIAERLGKEVAPLDVVGGEQVWIDFSVFRPFLHALVNVFRNAVVHGVEEPDERLASGKDEVGHIACLIEVDRGGLCLSISDDGRGIDIEALRSRAVAERLLSGPGAAPAAEPSLLDLVFADSVSTHGSINEFAGRGIGLAAVRAEVRNLGGSVEVSTSAGRGTTFTFVLPLTHAGREIVRCAEELLRP